MSDTTHDELERLYAQLGKLLFEEAKRDERLFLMAPDLYLAIERLERDDDDDASASCLPFAR